MYQSYNIKSDKTFGQRHLPLLRQELKNQGLDGFVIPHDDEYKNEYLPDCSERLRWITGFSGSAGFAVVLTSKAAVFADGRYTIQVNEQVDSDLFEICHYIKYPPHEWLAKNLWDDAKLGYDPWLHTVDSVEQMQKVCEKAGATLVACERNPLDTVWEDRPNKPLTQMKPHPTEVSGESTESKRVRIGEQLSDKGSDAVAITFPASIAWLFNVRGGDVAHTPVSLAQALLHKDGTADLFVDPRKVTKEVEAHLGNSVSIRPEEELKVALETLGSDGKIVEVDPSNAPSWFFDRLKGAGASVRKALDPCIYPRAQKNETEREGARQAHIQDGAAMAKFLHWLSIKAPKGELDEIKAAKKLEEIRIANGMLEDISFTTISGAGPNAALPHYSVNVESNLPIKIDSIYLVDSGGQYLSGTTDITRTIVVGSPTDEMKDRFTRVLKGHIGISACRFPSGTSGLHIDVLARHAMWQAGLDYDHGTGHGVGSYLGVHEGPQSISRSPKSATAPLKEGMILSNEPGYYKQGEYGIRIENLLLVTPLQEIEGGERPMHGFEVLTFCPIDLNLVDVDLLSLFEKHWLNKYHEEVSQKISPLVEGEVKDWLKAATSPI